MSDSKQSADRAGLSGGDDLKTFASQRDESWLEQLNADPEQDKHAPNRSSREVFSGHYVKVRPTPLAEPRLVAYSAAFAKSVGISAEECQSDTFLRFFSGDSSAVPSFNSW